MKPEFVLGTSKNKKSSCFDILQEYWNKHVVFITLRQKYKQSELLHLSVYCQIEREVVTSTRPKSMSPTQRLLELNIFVTSKHLP